MNKLAIFDVDGTLIDSMGIDGICYVQSVKEVLNIQYINEDWSAYNSATDKAIFIEIYEKNFHERPSAKVMDLHVKRFVQLLKMHVKNESIRKIPGANEIFKVLMDNNWNIGIATGCWRESILYKLKIAGVDVEGLPLVTSSEMENRKELVSECVRLSKKQYLVNEYERIVIIGDVVWDGKVAKESGFGFVGIKNGNDLSNYTKYIVDNYLDTARFINCMECAHVSL